MTASDRLGYLWSDSATRAAVIMSGGILLGAFASLLQTSGTGAASIDFRVFWAAGSVASEGRPLAVFDHSAMREVINAGSEGWFPWAYPPAFLALVTPLALLPFPIAWLLFGTVSLVALWWAVGHHEQPATHAWRVLAFAPAFLPALVIGQTSVLWFAGLLAALGALFGGQKLVAGILIGCLTLKPQLGLVIPIALILGREWRVFLSAALTTIALVALPTLWVGFSYWSELVSTMSEHGARMIGEVDSLPLMVSPFSLFSVLGLGPSVALILQYTMAAIALMLIAMTWHPARRSADLRAATVMLGVGLASPYLWYYDSAFLAPLAFFLARSGAFGTGPGEHAMLLLFWIGAGPLVLSELFNPGALPMRALITPLMIAALGATALAVYRARKSVPVHEPSNS